MGTTDDGDQQHPARVRLARWRVVGVLARCGVLVLVLALGGFAMRHLLGSPGSGPDPDIGAGMAVLGAAVLTAALGALRDARRVGFGTAAGDWTLAIAVLTLLGSCAVLWSWLSDRAAGVGGGLATGAVDLVGPLVALGSVAGSAMAVAVVGAALGEALKLRRPPAAGGTT